MKHYFDFSGTISGTNYFLRNVISVLLMMSGAIVLAAGINEYSNPLQMVGGIEIILGIIINLSNLVKRMRALFPLNFKFVFIGFAVATILSNSIVVEFPIIAFILNLALFIFGLVLIFKNSDVEIHNG